MSALYITSKVGQWVLEDVYSGGDVRKGYDEPDPLQALLEITRCSPSNGRDTRSPNVGRILREICMSLSADCPFTRMTNIGLELVWNRSRRLLVRDETLWRCSASEKWLHDSRSYQDHIVRTPHHGYLSVVIRHVVYCF